MPKKRKAFIGLSTPIGFDYNHNARRTNADQSSSPNPILNSPFGLMLLYDEIVFLTKSLCPENMRNLPYVTFLDKTPKLPNINEIANEKKNKDFSHIPNLDFHSVMSTFTETLQEARATWLTGIDNHTHGLKIGNFHGVANCTKDNFLIDLMICHQLNDPNLELIVNSRFHDNTNNWDAQDLAEIIVISDIPNYLTPQGPYHESIDEIRENIYLKDFRNWIINQSKNPNKKEITEIKKSVENELIKAQHDVFIKNLESQNCYKSIGKAVLSDLAGLAVPLLGTAEATVNAIKSKPEHNNMKWQGFVIDTRYKLQK